MATTELTDTNFERVMTSNALVLIDFWAAWCAPCRMFAPTFERASEKHPDVVFAKVDTEQEQALAGAFGVRAIPTLAVLKEGIVVFVQAGALPPAALEDLVTQAKALDMDAVRAKLAREENAARPSPTARAPRG